MRTSRITRRRKTAKDLKGYKMGTDVNGNGDTPQQGSDGEDDDDLLRIDESGSSLFEHQDDDPVPITPPTPDTSSSSDHCTHDPSKGDEETKGSKYWIMIVGGILGLGLICYLLLLGSFEQSKSQTEAIDVGKSDSTMGNILENLKHLQTEFPGQESKFWNQLKGGVGDLLRENKPLVMLLIHTPQDDLIANCLARKLLTSLAPNASSIRASSVDQLEDYGSLVEQLRTELSDAKGVFLEGLHKLPGHLALALHVVCDRESPLVAGSVVVMTLEVASLDRKGAENVLADLWKGHMCEDKFPALLVRVAAVVLAVEPHDTLPESC
ncbi:Hypothetical predicted protein [Cloeon dipterum]|uniref:Torsin-1A-interacting protein 1 n=1 Tax=Cloeon dipterum TaxID=197152 RepID=A0A8S1DIG3_9INSE|nr:Hypothetical predicted protein [Cloeon dipterum]